MDKLGIIFYTIDKIDCPKVNVSQGKTTFPTSDFRLRQIRSSYPANILLFILKTSYLFRTIFKL